MSDRQFYVKSIAECPHCYSSGFVQHPLWEQYWDDNGYCLGKINQKWWADHGYCSIDLLPPEEVRCQACNGAGRIVKDVPLVEALKEIGYCTSNENK